MEAMDQDVDRLLDMIVGHLDVPKSYYERAAARHRSLGEWLHRDESKLVDFDPDIRPQGSFRYGTVIPPIRHGEGYDLDNVCLLRKLGKTALTQEQLKALYGEEIRAYAKANNMLAPVTEHHRCWRLNYADEVDFHLDTLPCVPEDEGVIRHIVSLGVRPDLARKMVAITDRRHPQYRQISALWLSSNPRGFAAWFEERAALGRRPFVDGAARAAVEDVPPYEWRTTLQRSIQILKRHRDVMFVDSLDLAPISMIITNLAAQAYDGDDNLLSALQTIVTKMGDHVRPEKPRVPNPADPAEDYADKWARDPRQETNFWNWLAAVRADVARLPRFLGEGGVKADIESRFRISLSRDELKQLGSSSGSSSTASSIVTPIVSIRSGPRPWGNNA